MKECYKRKRKSFNPRTRVGCDLAHGGYQAAASQRFNPRTRVGCDDALRMIADIEEEFQSTHPRGVRPWADAWSRCRCSFNPRTRVGCDIQSDIRKLLSETGFNPRTRVGCDVA